jgi:hypothetical protein
MASHSPKSARSAELSVPHRRYAFGRAAPQASAALRGLV